MTTARASTPPWKEKYYTPRLTYVDRTFILRSHFLDRQTAKNAGFRWSPDRKYWWSREYDAARNLIRYADYKALAVLVPQAQPIVINREDLLASRATDAMIDIPAPDGLAYMAFQRAGIAYCMARPNVLIGDEMGLGKTIQAIGVINADPSIKHVVVVCPASLKTNWRRELERWLVKQRWINVIDGDYFAYAEIVVINYDRLHKFERQLRAREWDLLIADEVHYAKTKTARRSQHLLAIPAKRKLFLTGTPIVNRPAELWTLVHALAPDIFNDERAFTNRYCFTRNRNTLNELQAIMRSNFMVRRLKKDVLMDLPPKLRQVIELPPDSAADAVGQEQQAVAKFTDAMFELRLRVELAKASDNAGEYTMAVKSLKAGASAFFGEISRLRHQTALAKVPAVKEHVREALAGGQKVVLFAHHHDVIAAYMEAFGKVAVQLTGQMDMRDRQASVDAFQRDAKIKLFVGSIQAAGVGLTLTASSHVIFAELDWVPGNMSQAEDRTHRIGQRDSVLVQHLVLEGSLDATMAKTLVEKQIVIDAALDAEKGELLDTPIVPLTEGHATANVTRDRLERDAATLTADNIEAAGAALKAMAGVEMNRVDRALVEELGAKRTLTRRQAAMALRIVRKYEVKP